MLMSVTEELQHDSAKWQKNYEQVRSKLTKLSAIQVKTGRAQMPLQLSSM